MHSDAMDARGHEGKDLLPDMWAWKAVEEKERRSFSRLLEGQVHPVQLNALEFGHRIVHIHESKRVLRKRTSLDPPWGNSVPSGPEQKIPTSGSHDLLPHSEGWNKDQVWRML
jgi:hypothetical protein